MEDKETKEDTEPVDLEADADTSRGAPDDDVAMVPPDNDSSKALPDDDDDDDVPMESIELDASKTPSDQDAAIEPPSDTLNTSADDDVSMASPEDDTSKTSLEDDTSKPSLDTDALKAPSDDDASKPFSNEDSLKAPQEDNGLTVPPDDDDDEEDDVVMASLDDDDDASNALFSDDGAKVLSEDDNVPYSPPKDKPKEIACDYCDVKCERRQELRDHHNALHTDLQINLAKVRSVTWGNVIKVGKKEKKLTTYKCPECEAQTNTYQGMRDHLWYHIKPYHCLYYCPHRLFKRARKIQEETEEPHKLSKYKRKLMVKAWKSTRDLLDKVMVVNDDGAYENVQEDERETWELAPKILRPCQFLYVEPDPKPRDLLYQKSITFAYYLDTSKVLLIQKD